MRTTALALAALLATPYAALAKPAALNVEVEGITPNAAIPPLYATCKPTADGKSTDGDNLRPTIRWSNAPAGTASFAIIVTDPDVPADFTDAGKEGKVVPEDAPRQLFYHWALTGIPASENHINGGDAKTPPSIGTQHVNSLGSYVATPAQYGGPCPPWNDARTHHYHFTVYALDDGFKADAKATAAEVEAALAKHVLAHGSVTGTYSLNQSRAK